MEYIVVFLLILILHPYITYPASLLLFNRIHQGKQDRNQVAAGDFRPRIAVLIAAYNEEKVIRNKIINTIQLDYPADKLAVLVGSDGSEDRTNSIVQDLSVIYPNVKLAAYPEREGKVNVLNKTIGLCNAEIVVFSDANALYNVEALGLLARHFRDPNIGCVAGEKQIATTGSEDSIGKNEGLYWRLESFIKKQESLLKTVIGADGALYAIRRELFRQLPRDAAVDDFLLSMQVVLQVFRIVYEPCAYSCEDAGRTLQEELKRKVRIAAGNFYNMRYLHKALRGDLLAYMFISHKILRWISPLLFVLLTICLAVQWDRTVFRVLLLFLVGSYGVAVLGYLFEQRLLRYRGISLLTHFYLTVYAQFLGWLKFCQGSQKSIWETVR